MLTSAIPFRHGLRFSRARFKRDTRDSRPNEPRCDTVLYSFSEALAVVNVFVSIVSCCPATVVLPPPFGYLLPATPLTSSYVSHPRLPLSFLPTHAYYRTSCFVRFTCFACLALYCFLFVNHYLLLSLRGRNAPALIDGLNVIKFVTEFFPRPIECGVVRMLF